MVRIAGRTLASWVAAVAVVGALLAAASSASAARPAMVPGQVLVKFKDDATPSEIRAVMDDLGATRIKRLRRIRAEQDRITRYTVQEAVDRYRNHRAIEFIEPNYIVRMDAVPNDPSFDQQWSLLNRGQTGGLPGADIDATLAWDQETGSPTVVVAIIDTGTDYNHPDLAANIWTNSGEVPDNGVDDDGNGFVDDVHGFDFRNQDSDPTDDNGHGTHTAGTVAAVGNNGVGIAGVAWHAKIMPLKFLDAGGEGEISDAVESVEYAVMMGATIMNNSWGGGDFSLALQAAIQDADQAGVLFVASAGNSGADLDQVPVYPASYAVPNVIAVASTTSADLLSTFSNFGAHTVHLAAPGSSILSTIPGGRYATLSGTSMAAPHVSGALALLKSRYPSMPAATMKAVLLGSVDAIPSFEGVVISGGRLNAFRMLAGLDSISPAPIADLRVVSTSSNRIALRWTATGDDGTQGRASRYDVRFDVRPIEESSFGSAIEVRDAPNPAAAGTTQETTVSGLDFSTVYYFAIRAVDEYRNASPISNVATGTTQGAPDIAVDATPITQSLLTGANATRVLTLGNVGEGSLDFSVEITTPAPSGAAPPSLVLAKGEADPRIGDPVIQGFGGPDAFGHRWSDSDQPGGPAFEWIDITGDGVRIPLQGDDEVSSRIGLGFSFPYFESAYSEVRVSTNGFLAFTTADSPYMNQPLPSEVAPENILAPFWDDLIFSGSTAYAQFDGTRFIVEWANVYHAGAGGPYTFEAILYPDGTIVFQYRTMAAPLNSATIGIQNSQRSSGLTVAFNTSYVHDGLAVRIYPTPRWISASPATGTVLAGQQAGLNVRLDAAGLEGGDYHATLRVGSNDPDESSILVPVDLHVDPAPNVATDFPSLYFGTVFLGSVQALTLQIANEGASPLSVTSTSAAPGDYEVDNAPATLAPGTAVEIEVRFRPSRIGAIQGSLTIASNDPDQGILTIPLTGEGVLPPDVSVAPTSLSGALLTGQTVERTFTVSNSGGSNLSVNLAVKGVAAEAGVVHPNTSVLVIQDTPPSGLDLGAFLEQRFGITATVIPSSRIADTGFSEFDLVITVGDQTGAYYARISANAARFQAFAEAGGVVQYQLATGEDDVLIADGVLVRYGGAENENRVLLPSHPIVAGLPVILEGDYANNGYVTQLPSEATIITETFQTHLPTTVEYKVGAGTVIVTGMPWESLYTHDFDSGRMLVQSTGYTLSLAGPRWLQVSPESAVIAPGGSAQFLAGLDAARLAGGGHDKEIQVSSNDPDQPALTIPVHLDVTGAPDITLSANALDFGSLFLTTSSTDTLLVRNDGPETLSVTAIDIDDPDFQADASSFTVAPGKSRPALLTFAPTRTGAIHGTATVRSSDPDEPALSVTLTGAGLEPPDVSVAPGAFDEALPSGETLARTLTISNRRGGDLEFEMAFEPVSPAASGGTGPAPATTMAWGQFRQAALAYSTPPPPGLPEVAAVSLPVVIQDPPADGGAGEFTVLRAGVRQGSLQVEMDLSTTIVPDDFGGFLSLDIDQNRATGVLPSSGNPYQDIGAEYEFRFFSLATGVVALVDLVKHTIVANLPVQLEAHSIRFAAPLTLIGGDDGSMDVTGVIGSAFEPTDWFPNTGHGTIGGVDWLAADPPRGIVPAGSSVDVMLTFDAGNLDAGVHGARVVVKSNDPDEPRVEVPVRLTVTALPPPILVVEPDSIVAAAPPGGRKQKTMRVRNPGGSELRWTASVPETSWLSIAPSSGAVPAGSFADLTVTFDAGSLAAGDYHASVPFSSNQPDQPAVAPDFLFHVASIPAADAEIAPSTLNLRSSGRWITARVELPAGYDPARVVTSTVRFLGVVPPEGAPMISDFNHNHVPDLEYKFDRAAVVAVLPEGDDVLATVAGEIEDTAWFVAAKVIRIVRARAASAETDGEAPRAFALYQNVPNPFNPATEIRFDMPAAGRAGIRVYGVDGRLVRAFALGTLPAGQHWVRWDGRDGAGREVGSGVYFYRLEVSGAMKYDAIRRMLVVK